MNICRENIPILQDFIPYRGHCPASPQGESRAGQGNGCPFDAFGLLIFSWVEAALIGDQAL